MCSQAQKLTQPVQLFFANKETRHFAVLAQKKKKKRFCSLAMCACVCPCACVLCVRIHVYMFVYIPMCHTYPHTDMSALLLIIQNTIMRNGIYIFLLLIPFFQVIKTTPVDESRTSLQVEKKTARKKVFSSEAKTCLGQRSKLAVTQIFFPTNWSYLTFFEQRKRAKTGTWQMLFLDCQLLWPHLLSGTDCSWIFLITGVKGEFGHDLLHKRRIL